jgi:CheY-like chemotaxis protein
MQRRILVVEDNQGEREIYSLLLNLEGYEVIAARNGRKGYKKAKEEKPDLIFTDITMPQMSGNEMTRRLRKKKKFKQIPIIAITGHHLDGEEAQAAMKAGANYVIDKTTNFDFLMDLIRQLIG